MASCLFIRIFTALYRLSVTLAKISQSLPELKRDGNTMMSSLLSSILYDDSSSTLAYTITAMLETVPRLTKQLEEDSQSLIRDLEDFRAACEYCLPTL